MKTVIFLVVISSFNLVFANCIETPLAQLPAEMPENTSMRFNESGGMAPTYFRIAITDNQLLIEDKKMNNKKSKKWVIEISNKEKAKLYKVFVDNKFDAIKNDKRKEAVYDASSQRIHIRAGKFSKNIAYGMNAPLSGKNLRRYKAVAKAIKALGKKHKDKAKLVVQNYAIIDYNPAKHSYIFTGATRSDLNNLEIEKVEAKLKDAIEEYNSKQNTEQKITELSKYKRQYVPVINKDGDKVVYVNIFCGTKSNWSKRLIEVKDGGNCYLRLYVNLTQNDYEKFRINGNG